VKNETELENAVLRNLLAHTTRAYERQVDELAAEKELAQVTLASIGDGVITTDAEGRVKYLNPVAEELTGWPRDEAQGRPLNDVLRLISEQGEGLRLPLADHLPAQHRVHLMQPTLLLRRDGQRFAVESSSAPIRHRDGRVLGSVIVFQDVSDRRLMALQLAHQASHDPLTGLLNRTAFDGVLSRSLASARRQGERHTLAYLDLDQFKVVNDTCGHFAGDELLRRVADLLRDRVRESDVVARLGGDEFAILLAGCPLDVAVQRVGELHKELSASRFAWQDMTFAVGASVGLVPVDARFESLADLLSAADHACYVAKEKGRSLVQVYRPEEAEFVRRHGEMRWVVRIQRTLEEGRFRLFAQPIRPLRLTGDESPGHAFEVLLRMVGDDGLIHDSSDFIRAAERYGLMRRLDRWVVENSLAALAELPAPARDGLSLCALNLSALSLGDEAFLDFLEDAVVGAAVEPARLCFEITETAAVDNLPQARRLIQQLGRRGCRFALDDFGSGMSSYGYLRDLAVQYLKIDGTFITDMVTDHLDRAMVASIHQVAQLLGLRTVAECVSSQAARDLLADMGVDYGQGNWIAPPRPLAEVAAAGGAA
jgi:diguanylate cyclase (GGDEF)-like protein/PAS domain S-box-containing protein